MGSRKEYEKLNADLRSKGGRLCRDRKKGEHSNGLMRMVTCLMNVEFSAVLEAKTCLLKIVPSARNETLPMLQASAYADSECWLFLQPKLSIS